MNILSSDKWSTNEKRKEKIDENGFGAQQSVAFKIDNKLMTDIQNDREHEQQTKLYNAF